VIAKELTSVEVMLNEG